jgi:glycosyltransferase involved in cell wall biosynthesis
MRERATVAVALPAYNAAGFLAAAIQSVLAQTYPVTEVVVVDDGSTDGTCAVAERFGSPVRLARGSHEGVGVARTRAVMSTRTEFVALMDADDMLTARSVEARMDALADDPNLDIVYGHTRCFAEVVDGLPVALDAPRPSHTPGSMLVRRSAFDRVGGFTAGLRVAEGLDWLLRAREAGLREATVDEHVQWRRVHGGNNSLQNRAALHEFPRALKQSLDRRRAAGRAP